MNAELIWRGYAYTYTRFPFRRQAEFIALEREARKHQYGLWSLSLRDGRLANLVKRYESLSLEGRKKLDELLEKLVREHPYEEKEEEIVNFP
ncbi:thermonuclease family protein [candidate division NPL-UPA2 bacterium]|nr:thermonuclease family protein [candidate division NPL-UPA2 bacterium]